MSDEDRARSAYEKALALRRSGQFPDAIATLSSVRGKAFGAMHRQCFDMLTEICFCEGNGAYVDKIIPALKNVRSKLRGTQYLEEETQKVVDIVMKYLRSMCVNANRNAEAMVNTPSDDDVALAALSGIPIAQRARERFLYPCEHGAVRLAGELFNFQTIGSSKKVLPIYNHAAETFANICKEFNIIDALERAAETITRTVQRLVVDPIPALVTDETQQFRNTQIRELEVDRKDFLVTESSRNETTKMLRHLLVMLTELGRWRQVWFVMSCLQHVIEQLMSVKDDETRELRFHSYRAMADTFWACNNVNYHSYCLSLATQVAPDEEKKTLATRALLAALCTSDGSEEQNPFAPYAGRTVSPEVVELFSEPVSKSALLNRLQLRDDVMNAVDASAIQLMRNLAKKGGVDFTQLHQQLSTALATDSKGLAQYETPLRQVILRHQLQCLALERNRIDVDSLAMRDVKLSDYDYVNFVEPTVLEDSAVPVEIDSRTRTFSFRNAAKSKMLSSFTKLSSRIDVIHAARFIRPTERPASAVTDAAEGAPTPSPKVAPISVADLEAAHKRSRAIHELQLDCCTTVERRTQDKVKKVEKERQDKLDERKRLEEEKREAAQNAQMAKLTAEYRERQRQERCKLVLMKLRTKYPGFKIDNSVATKSASAFEDEVTQQLAAFKRKGAEGDRKDVLKGNLFERALRHLEIPKRKEFDAKNAEQHQAERAAARENFLLQHRKEFEKRQQERVVLQKFLGDAAAFEEQWNRRRMADKGSKRDEQQSLLQQEMERLAAQRD